MAMTTVAMCCHTTAAAALRWDRRLTRMRRQEAAAGVRRRLEHDSAPRFVAAV